MLQFIARRSPSASDKSIARSVEFAVESLESRRMLAGDISVKISGDRLLLNGDSEDNSVSIFAINGQVIVDAYNNTTLSGDATSSRSFNTGIAENDLKLLRVNLRGGDDEFGDNQIELNARYVVNMGQGDDFFVIGSGERNGRITVKGGGGDDEMFVGESTVVNGDFSMNTGGGDDSLVFSNFGDLTFNGRARISLGGGDDALEFDPATVSFGMSPRSISGGGGSDIFDAKGTGIDMVSADFDLSLTSFEIDIAMPPTQLG